MSPAMSTDGPLDPGARSAKASPHRLFKGVDHVGWTVADLDAVARFYVEVFGAEELYRLGPFDARALPPSASGEDWGQAHLNVKDACVRLVMLRLADNLDLELLEYSRPAAAPGPPGNGDIGGHHLAFRVESLEAASDYLAQRGCRLQAIIEAERKRVRYVRDPWENQLELVETRLIEAGHAAEDLGGRPSHL